MRLRRKIFNEYLHHNGLRATQQRWQVFEYVVSREGHFTPEELYRELADRGAHVSRATMYRTLTHLLKAGLLREAVNVDGGIRFEAAYGHGHHDHLVCVSCGKMIEFRSPTIESLQRRVCSRYHFEPIEHTLQVIGYCNDCIQNLVQMGRT